MDMKIKMAKGIKKVRLKSSERENAYFPSRNEKQRRKRLITISVERIIKSTFWYKKNGWEKRDMTKYCESHSSS